MKLSVLSALVVAAVVALPGCKHFACKKAAQEEAVVQQEAVAQAERVANELGLTHEEMPTEAPTEVHPEGEIK
ncbi:hypothetical protein M1466_02675 [Candidatus Dependentiae bacterium]|nr:hypothetical protein [Candidatus Dependentiae bacterium]